MEITTEIKTDDYRIWYNSENSTVFCGGYLRLDGTEEYQPIMELLISAIKDRPTIVVNLRELEFLNSSGISMLSMFVIKVRQNGNIQLIFEGSEKILWQTKSLKNLQRLMPTIKLDFS
jgi:anti-anti-sigma factor